MFGNTLTPVWTLLFAPVAKPLCPTPEEHKKNIVNLTIFLVCRSESGAAVLVEALWDW
jgi:hypothetical protein